jgi:outer membrane biosynthesis protein TonB
MHSRKNCFAALLLAALLSTSCSHFTGHNDSAITTDIKAQMFSEPALKSASVDVSSKDGVVTLSGQVPDDAARLAAYKISTQTKGVTKVNDQMSVATAQAVVPPAPAVEPASGPASAPEPQKAAAKPKHAPKREAAQQEAPVPPVTSVDQPAPAAAAAPPPAATAPPPPPQPVTVTIPASTVVTVRTIDSIDSKTNQAGQVFKASLDAPIVVDNNVVIPSGGDVYLKLVNSSSAGHFTGRSELTLALTSVIFQGKTYNVSSSDVKQSGSSRGKRTAATVGGGAALGALIGAVAGGGKGAAIGAAVGGGAGTGVQVFTKGQQVKIPSETRLDFTLEQPFDVTYLPGKKSRPNSNSDQPSN